MALKVCQLCAVDFTVDKFLKPLVDGMTNEGWDVTIVCSNGDNTEKLIKQGYKIKSISISRSVNPFKAILSIINLYKYFKKSKFDVIHVHTPVASLLARIAAWLSCKSYIIYTAHGFYFHENMSRFKKIFFINLEKFAGRFTNLLFCQSNEDSQDAINENIMNSNDVITIGNGVNIEEFDYFKFTPNNTEKRIELGIPLNAIVVGIVARKVKEKGYIEFLTAAGNINSTNKNVYFLLIGSKLKSDHDDGIEIALDYSKQLLGNNLLDLGHRDDIASLISIMDIFCLPSYREGLPRTIIEAMLLKKAVIATNIRGCREEVIHNKTGLLVPLRDTIELTKAISYLINNKNIAIEMGLNGYLIAKELFNEENIVKLQIKIIKDRLQIL